MGKLRGKNILARFYPIPSGILIGLSLIVLQPALVADYYIGSSLNLPVLAASFLILAGWAAAFVCPRRVRRARNLKVLGVGFVAMVVVVALGSLWEADPEVNGDFPDVNPYFCCGLLLALMVMPISYILFWLGIIGDCVPEWSRLIYYMFLLLPFLVPAILMVLALHETMHLVIITFGIHSMCMGALVHTRRKKAERKGEFDLRRSEESDIREALQSLDSKGFRG